MLELNDNNFEEEVLRADKPVLVDFYAAWCGPCRILMPLIENISNEVKDAKVGKFNIEDGRKISTQYKIDKLPTTIVFKDGKVSKRFEGLPSKMSLLDALK